jgi:hypothetical protein
MHRPDSDQLVAEIDDHPEPTTNRICVAAQHPAFRHCRAARC